MHEFLAGSWCFVVRSSASRRSFRRPSRIFRSTRVLKLSETQLRPIKRNFSFIILLANDQQGHDEKFFRFESRLPSRRCMNLSNLLRRLDVPPYGTGEVNQGNDFVRRPNIIAHACLFHWRRARHAQGSFKAAKSPACSCVSL